MFVFDIAYWLLSSWMLLAFLYLALLTIAALLARRRLWAPLPDTLPRILTLIPAHNESAQVTVPIGDLLRAHYPRDRYDVLVLADNCVDDTAAQAKAAGALVLERNVPELRGKGHALDWFLRNHQKQYARYDALAIVDADTRVDVNFLPGVAGHLARGAQAVQAYYGVSNEGEGGLALVTAASLALLHHVRSAGRTLLGASSSLMGNGMAFDTKLLARTSWPAHIVEDLAMTLLLIYDGFRVVYTPHARVDAEMIGYGRHADMQRRRWEGGRVQLIRQHTPRLLKRFLATRRWVFLDAWLDLISPLSLLAMALAVLSCWTVLLRPKSLWVPGTGIALFLLHVLLGLWTAQVPAATWKALLHAPLFLFWKALVLLRLVRHGSPGWERTTRKRELNDSGKPRP